jgi:hypothetical protein
MLELFGSTAMSCTRPVVYDGPRLRSSMPLIASVATDGPDD